MYAPQRAQTLKLPQTYNPGYVPVLTNILYAQTKLLAMPLKGTRSCTVTRARYVL